MGRDWLTIRRGLVAALLLAGAALVVVALAGVWAAGVHWDAGIDTQAALDIASVPGGLSLDDAYARVFWTSEFYGTLVQSTADRLHGMVTGISSPLSPDARETYLWQNSIVVTVAAIGSLALAYAIAKSMGSWLSGAFVFVLTWSIPLYSGMSHINAKDMPVAAGLTMVSAGVMLVLAERFRRWPWSAIGLAAIGSAIAMGQRGGSWALVTAVLVSGLVGGAILSWRDRRPRTFILTGLLSCSALATGIATVALMNPIARIDLARWLVDAVQVASKYPLAVEVRAAGATLVSVDLPWWYVPAWLWAQLPLATGIAVVSSIVVLAILCVRGAVGSRRTVVTAFPLLTQGVLIPLVIVLSGATLYNGLRHVLFIIPALVGIVGVAATLAARSCGRLGRWTVGIIAALALVTGIVDVVRWWPYAYAYVNPIAAARSPAERDWDLDAWGVSSMEGVLRLREAGYEQVAVTPSDFPAKIVGGITYEAAGGQRLRSFGLYRFIAGTPRPLPPGCEPLFTIERAGLPLGEGAVCRR